MKNKFLLISFVILFTFSITITVTANSPPDYTLMEPSDDSSTHDKDVLLKVYIDDPDYDTVDVEFRDDGDDSLIGTDTVSGGAGSASTYWDLGNPSDDDTFNWYICVDDGTYDACSDTVWSFTYTNSNPTYSDLSPSDGSSTHSQSVTLSADISDSDDDDVSVAFWDDSDDTQIGNDIVYDGSGTASTTWTHGGSGGETFSWYISVNDDHGSGNLYSTPIYDFTYTNSNPSYSSPSPCDECSTHSTSVTLGVTISDSDGDSVDVTFYDDSDDSQIGTDTVSGGSGTASTTWNIGTPSDGDNFDWYISVNDDHGSGDLYSTPVWTFYYDNSNPSYSNPSPEDDGTTDESTVTLSVDISDSDGDSVDVTFYDDSDDSQIGTDTVSGGSGTASTTWTHGGSDGDTLSWYIGVNDNHGSGDLYSTPVWSFTYDTVSDIIEETLNINTTFDIYGSNLVETIHANTTFDIYGSNLVETIHANTTFDIVSFLAIADFSYIIENETVYFTDESTFGKYWSWNFGDNDHSTGRYNKNVAHKYPINWDEINNSISSIDYVVTLEVCTSSFNICDSVSKTITLNRPSSITPEQQQIIIPTELIIISFGILVLIAVLYLFLDQVKKVLERK